jgi:two-component system LytT family sensor kinase
MFFYLNWPDAICLFIIRSSFYISVTLLEMNTQMNKPKRKYKFLPHLVAWLVYMACECGSFLINTPPRVIALYVLLPFVANISLFYFCAGYLFPTFYDKKRIFEFVLLTLMTMGWYLILAGWLGVVVMLYESKPGEMRIDSLNGSPGTTIYILIWRGTWFIALAAAYWRAKKLIATKKSNNILLENYYGQELRQEELKQVIVTTELAYIKAQINPHFLFNTLNFLYSNVYPLSKDIARSVLMLSDIMRFVMENNEGNDTTELSLEIRYVENYIRLNQLRLHHSLYIDLEYTGTPEGKKIMPFILMTLVENAFKHGDLTDAKNPLKIRLGILKDNIWFRISNKIRTIKRYEDHGIGMNNLEKSLELFYGDYFKLDIQNDGEYYSCALEIDLNPVPAEVALI